MAKFGNVDTGNRGATRLRLRVLMRSAKALRPARPPQESGGGASASRSLMNAASLRHANLVDSIHWDWWTAALTRRWQLVAFAVQADAVQTRTSCDVQQVRIWAATEADIGGDLGLDIGQLLSLG